MEEGKIKDQSVEGQRKTEGLWMLRKLKRKKKKTKTMVLERYSSEKEFGSAAKCVCPQSLGLFSKQIVNTVARVL